MSKSPYVSPNLRPTTPWAGQTSTGLFRPPESFALHSSSHELSSAGEEPAQSKRSPSFTVSVGDPQTESSAPKETDSRRTKPSPMLQATAPPFYPPNANSPDYGFMPPPPPFRQHASAATLPPVGTYTLEQIIQAITCVVHHDEDSFASVKESNRALEAEIQQMQEVHQMQMQQIESLDEYMAVLRELVRDQMQFLEQHNVNHGVSLDL